MSEETPEEAAVLDEVSEIKFIGITFDDGEPTMDTTGLTEYEIRGALDYCLDLVKNGGVVFLSEMDEEADDE